MTHFKAKMHKIRLLASVRCPRTIRQTDIKGAVLHYVCLI